MKMMPMKEFRMDNVMVRLLHEMSKCKEKEPQGEDAAMVLRQSKEHLMFLLWQAGPYCGFLLQNKEQRVKKMQRMQGTMRTMHLYCVMKHI